MLGAHPHAAIHQAVSHDPGEINSMGAPGPTVAKKSPKTISVHGVSASGPSLSVTSLSSQQLEDISMVRWQHPASLKQGVV